MKSVLAFAVAMAALTLPVLAQLAPPPQPETSTDPQHCTWEWRAHDLASGGAIGIWGETCKFETGTWEPAFDAALPGFVLTVDGAPQETVVHLFAKPDDADVSAILPELRREGLIPDDDDCVFMPASQETLATIGPTIMTRIFYEIRPTGERLAAFDATPADEVPEPPCGAYGWSTHGVRYFMTDFIRPDEVVYFNIGQDGTMIAPTTLMIE